MNYETAEENCALKFSGGFIAEPKTVKVNDLLYAESKRQFAGGRSMTLWIGIGYSDSKSNFIYKSNNQIIDIGVWADKTSTYRKRSETTYCGTWYYGKWYHNMRCVLNMESICQSTYRFVS